MFLHNAWWWGFMLCGAIAAGNVVSMFLPRPFNVLVLWVWVVERFYGPLDAPDNWAMGITYCVKTSMILSALACGMGLVGIVKVRRAMKGHS